MRKRHADNGRRRALPETASEALLGLYRRAFAEYRAQALWNIRELEAPTIEEALAITRQLRTEGDMGARRLAEAIEKAARADH